jgi:putative nucleotidyltransferase with HDIG domain
MTPSRGERWIHVFGHAMAAHTLYAAGHQSRVEASERLFAAVEELLSVDRQPTFTFLDDAIIYRSAPLHGMGEWSWAKKLRDAGIRRIEFTPLVTRESVEDFLAALLHRLGGEGRDAAMPRCLGIEAGDVVVRSGAEPLHPQTDVLMELGISLSGELSAVRYVFQTVAAGGALPLGDAEAVVRALTVALHSEGELLVPLLQLRSLDDHAALHAVNTAVLAMTFCEWLGLAGGDIRAVGKAALLHDIGMARVSREVFLTPTISAAGKSEVSRHPAEGARLLLARSAKLDLAATIAYEHHLTMNGGGYPVRGFHGDLHYITRIIAVCGAYNALRSERSYRPARAPMAALLEIENGAGSVYDPGIAHAFVQMMRRWENRVVTARSE